MTKEEFDERESLLTENFKNAEKNFKNDLHKLRKQFIEEGADFKVGDFIYNVTGIIKVERIGYDAKFGYPDIIYYGYRYKKEKGVLSRTKTLKFHV